VIRNLKELKYPYGYETKERFRLRGQLFARKKVCFVRFVQGEQNSPRICKMPIMPEAEEFEKDSYGDRHCHRLLSAATGIPACN